MRMKQPFKQAVQRQLPHIAYGRTRSYQEVAELVGNPKAVLAVGSACAKNPLPVVVPCHRVLRNDGTLGDYIGGLDAKTVLVGPGAGSISYNAAGRGRKPYRNYAAVLL